jgi:hypothetical protein
MALIIDIAYYFAEVFVRNHPGVRWIVYKSKVEREVDRNEPILSGFIVPMNPRALVRVAAGKTIDKTAGDDQLLHVYHIWIGNLKRPRRK